MSVRTLSSNETVDDERHAFESQQTPIRDVVEYNRSDHLSTHDSLSLFSPETTESSVSSWDGDERTCTLCSSITFEDYPTYDFLHIWIINSRVHRPNSSCNFIDDLVRLPLITYCRLWIRPYSLHWNRNDLIGMLSFACFNYISMKILFSLPIKVMSH
jgi:hypothetical protein